MIKELKILLFDDRIAAALGHAALFYRLRGNMEKANQYCDHLNKIRDIRTKIEAYEKENFLRENI